MERIRSADLFTLEEFVNETVLAKLNINSIFI